VDYLDVADRLWPVLGPLMRGHARIYRATGGRIGGNVPGVPKLLLLDHVGAKSGRLRTTPLVYMPIGDGDGDQLLIVASKGGYPHDPGWMHNLRANPDTSVQLGRCRLEVHAREATRDERERLWPRAARYNPHWGRYRTRTSREIPFVLLEPR
jgi:deazaflavin-dependent oxidoreductase (nitroreductase family)